MQLNKKLKEEQIKSNKKEKKKIALGVAEKHKTIKKEDYDPDWIANSTKEEQDSLYNDAFIHAKSSIVGDRNPDQSADDMQTCTCCGKIVDKVPLPIGCPTIGLDFLGPGYVILLILEIKIKKFAGSYSFFSNGVGHGCKTFRDGACIDNFTIDHSFVNKTGPEDKTLTKLQDILNLFTVFAIMMLLQIFRHQQRVINQQCDNGEISAGDYALMIRHIPKTLPVEKFKDYKDYIKQTLESTYPECVVSNISIAYNQTGLQVSIAAKRQKVVELQKRLTIQYNTNQWPTEGYEDVTEADLRAKIDAIEKSIDDISGMLEKAIYPEVKNEFTGIAFVSFESEHQKQDILDMNRMNALERWQYNKIHKQLNFDYVDDAGVAQTRKVHVEQAPEPTDIMWNNLHANTKTLRIRSYVGGCLVFLSLFLCFALIFILAKQQQIYAEDLERIQNNLIRQQNHTNPASTSQQQFIQMENTKMSHQFQKHQMHYQFDAQMHHLNDTESAVSAAKQDEMENDIRDYAKQISLIATILGGLIAVLNKVLVFAMGLITDFQLPFTKTVKLSFCMFFNTAIQTFLIKVILPWNIKGFQFAQDAIVSPSGLTVNENMVILQNVLITNILNLINISYLMKFFYQWKANRQRGKQTATQQEINTTFELPEFTITQNYAFIINTMLLTAFYAPLLPIALFYSLICLFLAYWIYKFQLLRRRTVKSSLGVQLSQEMTDELELFLPIFSLGNLIFNTMLANEQAQQAFMSGNSNIFDIMFTESSFLAEITVVIGFLHYFLPTQSLNEIIMPLSDEVTNEVDYYSAKQENFEGNSYETENPVTKEVAMDRINEQMKLNQLYKQSLKAENQNPEEIASKKN